MSWTVVITVGVISLLAWLVFILLSPRTVGVSDFGTVTKHLLSSGKDGDFARFREIGGKRWFTLERTSEAEGKVEFTLRIPRATVSTVNVDEIESLYKAHDFDFVRQSEENVSIAATVPILLGNVEDEAVVARPSYAIRLLLNALGISASSQWHVNMG